MRSRGWKGRVAVTGTPCSSTTSPAAMRASQVERGMAAKRCTRNSAMVGHGRAAARRSSGRRRRGWAAAGARAWRVRAQAASERRTISAKAGRCAGSGQHAALLKTGQHASAACLRRRPAGNAPAAPPADGRRRAPRCAAGPAPGRHRPAAGRRRRRSRRAGSRPGRPTGCCAHRDRRAGCRAHAAGPRPRRCRVPCAARSAADQPAPSA